MCVYSNMLYTMKIIPQLYCVYATHQQSYTSRQEHSTANLKQTATNQNELKKGTLYNRILCAASPRTMHAYESRLIYSTSREPEPWSLLIPSPRITSQATKNVLQRWKTSIIRRGKSQLTNDASFFNVKKVSYLSGYGSLFLCYWLFAASWCWMLSFRDVCKGGKWTLTEKCGLCMPSSKLLTGLNFEKSNAQVIFS